MCTFQSTQMFRQSHTYICLYTYVHTETHMLHMCPQRSTEVCRNSDICIHIHSETHTHSHAHTGTYMYIQTCVHMHTDTHSHTGTGMIMSTQMQKLRHTQTHIYVCAHRHTLFCLCRDTEIHTHICTYTQPHGSIVWCPKQFTLPVLHKANRKPKVWRQ